MSHPRRIVLFGSSVFLAGVASCLRDDARLDIVYVDSALPHALAALCAHAPITLVYDRSNFALDEIMPLLYTCSTLVCIGIAADRDDALVLYSRQSALYSMQDLKQLLLQS